jgi:hypothetical protein
MAMNRLMAAQVNIFLAIMFCGFSAFCQDVRPQRPGVTIQKVKEMPVIDGKIDDLKGSMTHIKLGPPPSWMDDIGAEVYMGWDEKSLYIAAKVLDSYVINPNEAGELYTGDHLTLAVSVQNGNKLDDYFIWMAPTSKKGDPVIILSKSGWTQVDVKTDLLNPRPDDKSGIMWAVSKDDKGWAVEAAVPLSCIGLDNGVKKGMKIPFNIAVYDRDTDKPDERGKFPEEWKVYHKRLEFSSIKNPSLKWPLLVLGE